MSELRTIPKVFCAPPDNTVDETNGLFFRTACDSAVLAKAMGAEVSASAKGFSVVAPMFTSAQLLAGIPRLSDSLFMREYLCEIGELSIERHVMANVSAPYSLLAMLSSEKLNGWLIRKPCEVFAALERLTGELAWYITELFKQGVKAVSLADSYAQKDLLGEVRFAQFVKSSQLALLKRLLKAEGKGVVHLCPRSFCDFEEEYAEVNAVETNSKLYEHELLSLANAAECLLLVGRQCPNIKYADYLYYITIIGG